MATVDVSRDEVLAHMAAAKCGPAEAARHFGLNVNLVKQWACRARKAAGVTSSPRSRHRVTASVPAELHLLPPPRLSVDEAVADDLREGVRVRAARLRVVLPNETPLQSAQIMETLASKFELVRDTVRPAAEATGADPTPAEAVATLRQLAASLGVRIVSDDGEDLDAYDPETAKKA